MKTLTEIFGQLEKYELGTDKAKFSISSRSDFLLVGFICGKSQDGGFLVEY